MGCGRCSGLMVAMHFGSGLVRSGSWEYDGWLCLNCGNVVDPMILVNREAQANGSVALMSLITPRVPGWEHDSNRHLRSAR